MGQRFQIITKEGDRFKVYHSHWLWGVFAIRRIGTAVRNFQRYNENGYRSFEDFLKGSFYGKPNDMNSFERYNDVNVGYWDDNDWILRNWRDKPLKQKRFKDFLKTLDNNDGYFYIEFGDTGINGNGKGIKGYCFIDHDTLEPISAEQYMKTKWYANALKEKDWTKKQLKEYRDGLEMFSKLKVIDYNQTIKREAE